jgi:hypothetical protein
MISPLSCGSVLDESVDAKLGTGDGDVGRECVARVMARGTAAFVEEVSSSRSSFDIQSAKKSADADMPV